MTIVVHYTANEGYACARKRTHRVYTMSRCEIDGDMEESAESSGAKGEIEIVDPFENLRHSLKNFRPV